MTQAVSTVRGHYRPPSESQIAAVVEAMAKGNTLASACALARCSYTTLRSRIDRDEALASRIAEAQAQFHGVVIRELKRRAIVGVERAVYHKGEIVGTELKFSDRALMRLVDTIPEFNPKKVVEHIGEVRHQHEHTIAPAILAAMNPSARIDARRAALIQNARNLSDEAKQATLLQIAQDASRDSIPFDTLGLAKQLRIGKLADVVEAEFEEIDDETAEELRRLEEMM